MFRSWVIRVTGYSFRDTPHKNDIMIFVNVQVRPRMHSPNEAMIVGTSLTEMKSETLSMIPSKAEPKLRMSAGSNSPDQDDYRFDLNTNSHKFSWKLSQILRNKRVQIFHLGA